MYAEFRRVLSAGYRQLADVRGDWRQFVAGIVAEAAFVVLLGAAALLSVEAVRWMAP
jgi:hypothetical protein